jgi:hypothetical protein
LPTYYSKRRIRVISKVGWGCLMYSFCSQNNHFRLGCHKNAGKVNFVTCLNDIHIYLCELSCRCRKKPKKN